MPDRSKVRSALCNKVLRTSKNKGHQPLTSCALHRKLSPPRMYKLCKTASIQVASCQQVAKPAQLRLAAQWQPRASCSQRHATMTETAGAELHHGLRVCEPHCGQPLVPSLVRLMELKFTSLGVDSHCGVAVRRSYAPVSAKPSVPPKAYEAGQGSLVLATNTTQT